MDHAKLKDMLEQVKKGNMDIDSALDELKEFPFKDLGYAKIDSHRSLRTGVSEVIYCEGKELEHIRGIVKEISQTYKNIIATRANIDVYNEIKKVTSDCVYHKIAGLVVINPEEVEKLGNIAVVSAGTSDIPVAEESIFNG